MSDPKWMTLEAAARPMEAEKGHIGDRREASSKPKQRELPYIDLA
jgi:hypothetical protein